MRLCQFKKKNKNKIVGVAVVSSYIIVLAHTMKKLSYSECVVIVYLYILSLPLHLICVHALLIGLVDSLMLD